MRKTILALSAISMGLAMPTVTSPAHAQAPDLRDIQSLCAEISNEQPVTFGECVSVFVSTGMTDDALPAQLCRVLVDAGIIDSSEYSDCVIDIGGEVHAQ